MLPAHQSLKADDCTTGQINNWLIVQYKLVLLQGTAQFSFHLRPFHGLSLHCFIEDFVAASPPVLGTINSRVGVSQNFFRVAVNMAGRHVTERNTDADIS